MRPSTPGSHQGDTQHEPLIWTTHSAEIAIQLHQRNGAAHLPAGTLQALSCRTLSDSVLPYSQQMEQLAGFQDGVQMTANSHATAA